MIVRLARQKFQVDRLVVQKNAMRDLELEASPRVTGIGAASVFYGAYFDLALGTVVAQPILHLGLVDFRVERAVLRHNVAHDLTNLRHEALVVFKGLGPVVSAPRERRQCDKSFDKCHVLYDVVSCVS